MQSNAPQEINSSIDRGTEGGLKKRIAGYRNGKGEERERDWSLGMERSVLSERQREVWGWCNFCWFSDA